MALSQETLGWQGDPSIAYKQAMKEANRLSKVPGNKKYTAVQNAQGQYQAGLKKPGAVPGVPQTGIPSWSGSPPPRLSDPLVPGPGFNGPTAGGPGGFFPGGGGPQMPNNGGPGGGSYTPVQGLPPMYSQGTPGYQAPQYQDFGANSKFDDVYKRATEGSLNAYNTSANRLRERLDSSTMGMSQQAQNRNLSRGFGNSGLNSADQFRVQQQGQNAYAQGLNELSNQFEQNRLQGLQTALGAAGGQAGYEMDRNKLTQGDSQFGYGHQVANNNFMDKTLFDLLNQREGRANDLLMQDRGQKFSGGQNELDREQQRLQDEFDRLNDKVDSTTGMIPPLNPNIGGNINGSIGGGFFGGGGSFGGLGGFGNNFNLGRTY